MATTVAPSRKKETLDQAVIRFGGDSGDGMQITGSQFTNTAAALSATTSRRSPTSRPRSAPPPARCRASSGFQLHFASSDIYTPGDAPDVLVAMNPAALKMNVEDLKTNGILIVNTGRLQGADLKKAQLHDRTRSRTTRSTATACSRSTSPSSRARRSRTSGSTPRAWTAARTSSRSACATGSTTGRWRPRPALARGQVQEEARARRGQPARAEGRLHLLRDDRGVPGQLRGPAGASCTPGTYRNISGNSALALGLVAASQRAGCRSSSAATRSRRPPTSCTSSRSTRTSASSRSRPRTRSRRSRRRSARRTAARSRVTTTSGPGMALKTEAIGLAIATELPLVIFDIQRGGPSTGLPTKTEQADLLQALFGRNCEAPVPVLAPRHAGRLLLDGARGRRIAVKYMTPVILLSDGYLANGAEPWRLPDARRAARVPGEVPHRPGGLPALRARPEDARAARGRCRARPASSTASAASRSRTCTGNITYEPLNHEQMVRLRAAKVAGIAQDIPRRRCRRATPRATCSLVGWGSTYGAITAARARAARARAARSATCTCAT